MKILNWIFLSAVLGTGFTAVFGQSTVDSEVPGDNFSLEGALELFKKSDSPEKFERLLNSSDSKVNNLDLNNDGNIDYIKVIDRNEGNVHAFILQAVISERENQDVAVIELEKLHDGKAILQITGDANVYGIETIIEPSEEVRINAGASTARTVVNVWTWPSVQYVYGPYYNPWISPWTWAYHPMWWRPWSPVAFHVYNPWWRPYRPHYSFCYSHRIGYLPRLYSPYRTTSVYVYNNYRTQINHYRSHNDGRSRHDGRTRSSHDHYDGYAGRTRSDYNSTRSDDNRRGHINRGRQEATSNNSRNQSNGHERTRQSNVQSEYRNRSRSLSERSLNLSDIRRSPNQNSSGSDLKQRGLTTQRSSTEFRQQRQSSVPGMSSGSRQRSSSIERSSAPRQSGGVTGGSGRSHSGSHDSGNNTNRGRR